MAGQFEAFAAATLDNALAERAALYRLDGAESYVDACEREASSAIMGLLDSLPGEDAPSALRAPGTALPPALAGAIVGSRLTDTKLQREFRESRGDWSMSPHMRLIPRSLREGFVRYEFRSFMLRSLGVLVFGSEGPGVRRAFTFRCLLVGKTIAGGARAGRRRPSFRGFQYTRTGPGARDQAGRHLSFR